MRFLANENIPADMVLALRAGGHDVAWVRQDAPGMRDRDVLDWATREDRVLLTFDKDFGELAFAHGLPASSGVILLRLPMPHSGEVGARLSTLVSARDDWTGTFAVIESTRVRLRPLPRHYYYFRRRDTDYAHLRKPDRRVYFAGEQEGAVLSAHEAMTLIAKRVAAG